MEDTKHPNYSQTLIEGAALTLIQKEYVCRLS